MTLRMYALTTAAVLCLSPGSPAQLADPPAAEPKPALRDSASLGGAEGDPSVRLRQMQEDIGVFRMLFSRSAARYYNFPATRDSGMSVGNWFQTSHADMAHLPPSAEGVYLKGQGVIFTAGLPAPATHPVKKVTSTAVEDSAWERARLELRGEKAARETKPAGPAKQPLSDILLALLAENGHHFKQLAPEERIMIAVTMRPAESCVRCHQATAERAVYQNAPSRYQPGQSAAAPSPSPPLQGKPSVTLWGYSTDSGRDDGQNDTLLGDLALKQGRHKEAEEAYMKAIVKLGDKNLAEGDLRRLILLSQVSSKLAQCLLAAGQADKAKSAMEMSQKASLAAVKLGEQRGKSNTVSLPAQLIVSASKSQLDQVAGRKITFEEFSKSATIEYRTFDSPASPEGKSDGMK